MYCVHENFFIHICIQARGTWHWNAQVILTAPAFKFIKSFQGREVLNLHKWLEWFMVRASLRYPKHCLKTKKEKKILFINKKSTNFIETDVKQGSPSRNQFSNYTFTLGCKTWTWPPTCREQCCRIREHFELFRETAFS